MTTFNPKVSIIIPVYNGSNYISEAIESALAQTYKNIEIIVVNDGSNDKGATETIALSYGDRIRYFSKTNGGVATALNLGIEMMTGEYFSWLSHDDVYYKTKIETQIMYLDSISNKHTILYGGYHIIDANSDIVEEGCLDKKLNINLLDKGLYPLLHGLINGCTLLIHKDCFISVGLFDTNLRTTQDYALWFKMFKQFPVFFHKEILIQSRSHPEQGSLRETVHQKEATDLWITFIEETTERDILGIYNTLAAFYYHIANHLQNSYVPLAYSYVLDKINRIKYEVKVSVVLPTYNRAWCIQQAIESVLNQTFGCFEIIVIDDCSTDNTADIVKGYKQKVIYIRKESNEGAASARNIGIKAAKGQYIAFIDSDDIWETTHLEQHVRLLDSQLAIGMSYNYSKVVDQNNKVKGSYSKRGLYSDDYPELIFIKNSCITTPSVVARKLVLEHIGLFDETMDICEDLDLWRRIAKNYKIKCIPEFLTVIRLREHQFDPSLYFIKRKQFIEKAINDDVNLDENIILALYMELCSFYYFEGCTSNIIFDNIFNQTTLNKINADSFKKQVIKILAEHNKPKGVRYALFLLIIECLRAIQVEPEIVREYYHKLKKLFRISGNLSLK